MLSTPTDAFGNRHASGKRYLWGLELKYVEETPPIARIC
jgi:hypothetical protein